MKFILLPLIAVVLAPVVSLGAIQGLDKPNHVTKKTLGKSQDADGNVGFECWDYGAYAVAQINDPALVGAKDIEVRVPVNDDAKIDACAYTEIGKGTKIVADDGYFQGSRGDLLFIDGADTLGNALEFHVFSRVDGREIYKGTRDFGQPFVVKASGKTTTLTFQQMLKTECPLAKEGEPCWEKILKANAVPAAVKLKMPDCKKSFERAKSPLDNNAQVSAKVMIADALHPAVKFLGGAASCEATP